MSVRRLLWIVAVSAVACGPTTPATLDGVAVFDDDARRAGSARGDHAPAHQDPTGDRAQGSAIYVPDMASAPPDLMLECSMLRGEFCPSCFNGRRDPDELGIDCGGACLKCGWEPCGTYTECVSRSCDYGRCDAPCRDGVLNDAESDVDCGGKCSWPCAIGKRCETKLDCGRYNNVECVRFVCTHRCGNGRLDSEESDVDCGGICRGRTREGWPLGGCGARARCSTSLDCATDFVCGGGYGQRFVAMVCIAGACVGHCGNGVLDYSETDVDCGYNSKKSSCLYGSRGEGCAPCDDGKRCLTNADCRSTTCTGGVCTRPDADAGSPN